ncbi:alpha/beta fold hydrolase [Pajaroellobacter abortibovis]|uniref:AB hydrolase-1 domain-containing protein n=1 Tax=Pajaroellobacter abortibovis TaxID=1882918 RepID=A0A1L6MWD5_9BACT|nr:alpha/beta hydrolase [Pajaroellobacter abortibovis]APR99869.1 hypothetical protein BCY86_03635 [Pajaroellobacter abortibovis]
MNERHSSIAVREGDIHWVEIGKGRPLVLLHGLADSHRTWSRVAHFLARDRCVLMPDLLGHGLSSRPRGSYTVEWHAAAIEEWMDALQLIDVDMVGHSYGGGIAQFLSLKGKKRNSVRRLGLISPGGIGQEVAATIRMVAAINLLEKLGDSALGIGTIWASKWLKCPLTKEEKSFVRWMNSMPGSAAAVSRTIKGVVNWRGQTKSLWNQLHQATQCPPLIVFWGEKDPIVPFHHAVELVKQVPGVSLVRFPDCGHHPHKEYPELFVGSLSRFLRAQKLSPVVVVPKSIVSHNKWLRWSRGERRNLEQHSLLQFSS